MLITSLPPNQLGLLLSLAGGCLSFGQSNLHLPPFGTSTMISLWGTVFQGVGPELAD